MGGHGLHYVEANAKHALPIVQAMYKHNMSRSRHKSDREEWLAIQSLHCSANDRSALAALFERAGLPNAEADQVFRKEHSLKSVRDFEKAAETEEDARVWAEHLGLTGRVSIYKFVEACLPNAEADQVFRKEHSFNI